MEGDELQAEDEFPSISSESSEETNLMNTKPYMRVNLPPYKEEWITWQKDSPTPRERTANEELEPAVIKAELLNFRGDPELISLLHQIIEEHKNSECANITLKDVIEMLEARHRIPIGEWIQSQDEHKRKLANQASFFKNVEGITELHYHEGNIFGKINSLARGPINVLPNKPSKRMEEIYDVIRGDPSEAGTTMVEALMEMIDCGMVDLNRLALEKDWRAIQEYVNVLKDGHQSVRLVFGEPERTRYKVIRRPNDAKKPYEILSNIIKTYPNPEGEGMTLREEVNRLNKSGHINLRAWEASDNGDYVRTAHLCRTLLSNETACGKVLDMHSFINDQTPKPVEEIKAPNFPTWMEDPINADIAQEFFAKHATSGWFKATRRMPAYISANVNHRNGQRRQGKPRNKPMTLKQVAELIAETANHNPYGHRICTSHAAALLTNTGLIDLNTMQNSPSPEERRNAAFIAVMSRFPWEELTRHEAL